MEGKLERSMQYWKQDHNFVPCSSSCPRSQLSSIPHTKRLHWYKTLYIIPVLMPTPGHSKGKLHANTRAIKGQVNLTQHTPVVYIVQYNILIMYVWVQMVEVMYSGWRRTRQKSPWLQHSTWATVCSGHIKSSGSSLQPEPSRYLQSVHILTFFSILHWSLVTVLYIDSCWS